MKKYLLKIKENWGDPVWSIVIAFLITSLIGGVMTVLYTLILSLYHSISFRQEVIGIWSLLNSKIEVDIWLLLLFAVLFSIITFTLFTKIVIRLNKEFRKVDKIEKHELPIAPPNTTTFFETRIASAFPGLRGIAKFNNPKEATNRLELLLKDPIKFDPNSESEARPIWWFRGGRSLYIEQFKRLGKTKVLINHDQLSINRIVVYQSESYYKNFVYVEVKGEKQTRLYSIDEDEIKMLIEKNGYCREEYGIMKNKIGSNIYIRREDYDDGATLINGKVREIKNAKLRVRYLSDYNFIIAAKGSPYNSIRFSKHSKYYFNNILNKKIELDDFLNFLNSFEKHEGPYL